MHRLTANLEDLLPGFAVLALGGWLLFLNPRHQATRALAALLGVYGVAALELEDVLHAQALARLATIADAHAEAAIPFAALVFALLFPTPFWTRGRATRHAVSLVVLAGILAQLTLLARPALYGTIEPRASGGWTDLESEPLLYVRNARAVLFALLALVMVLRHARAGSSASQGLLLVAAGLASEAAVGVVLLRDDALGTLSYTSNERLLVVLLESAALLSLGVAAYCAWTARVAHEARRVAAASAVVVVAVAALALATEGALAGEIAGVRTPILIETVVDMLLPVLLAVAVMRHAVLDVQVKLRGTIARGTVPVLLLAVFFVVAQLSETLLSARYGAVAGGIAAGLLLFALTPLQRMAERVADAALPATAGRAGHEAVFRRAAAYALRGGLTRAEERHLAELASALRIDAATALRIREEVERDAPA